MVERTLSFDNDTIADRVMALVDIWRDKQREIAARYELLEKMYTSDNAIETRAAVARMCAIHNV
jgi:hypothetical protein